jgi:hypothetical protein
MHYGRGMHRTILLLALVLTVTYVSPAIGGPDLTAKLRRVDQREQRHYADLDRRIKATVLLTLNHRITTTPATASMTQSSDGRFFSGRVSCPVGQQLTGGGVDWGVSLEYADWHVVSSGPSVGGASWHATVHTGVATSPTTLPTVYAMCAKG